MLEYIWFATLMFVSFVFAGIAAKRNMEDPQWQLAYHGAVVMAIVISWDRLGAPALAWLMHSLPQQSSDINTLTAYAIVGVIGLVIVAAPPCITLLATMAFDRAPARKV